MRKRRYAIRLAYEGGPFRGFQRQAGLPTVQEALQTALRSLGIEAGLAVAARTDAGVHALAQVVSFATRSDIDPDILRRELNGRLPAGILCLDARAVAASFHARASATSRRYVYLVGLPAPEGLSPYAWSLPDPRAFPGLGVPSLDIAAMRHALSEALGRHDFAGFARPGAQRETVRELLRAEILVAESEPVIAFVLEGTGFLRAMVRNLVGTVVSVGLGVSPTGSVTGILEHPSRYAGVRAPGWGLTLAAVEYPSGAWAPEPRPGPA
ncbi:MAG TPA: tRNA pseudouridine(38-40) synthase TruA [Anaeromyxobacteraceae bacterium]|nr:tRNA pseudouridine(38-40) synthase TruA [Anaeromyxobacteraceae bacterium]